jgi:hypothetical protein
LHFENGVSKSTLPVKLGQSCFSLLADAAVSPGFDRVVIISVTGYIILALGKI